MSEDLDDAYGGVSTATMNVTTPSMIIKQSNNFKLLLPALSFPHKKMRKPSPKNIPNNFYFTGSDIKKFKKPSLLEDIKVDRWNNILELITITTNSRRRISKKSKRQAWIQAFKRIKETCMRTAISSFAGKMADYLEDEVGQEEFVTALHDREMAVLFKRLEQYRERTNIKIMIEYVHSMEKNLDNMVNANEQREMADEESDNNSLSD